MVLPLEADRSKNIGDDRSKNIGDDSENRSRQQSWGEHMAVSIVPLSSLDGMFNPTIVTKVFRWREIACWMEKDQDGGEMRALSPKQTTIWITFSTVGQSAP